MSDVDDLISQIDELDKFAKEEANKKKSSEENKVEEKKEIEIEVEEIKHSEIDNKEKKEDPFENQPKFEENNENSETKYSFFKDNMKIIIGTIFLVIFMITIIVFANQKFSAITDNKGNIVPVEIGLLEARYKTNDVNETFEYRKIKFKQRDKNKIW